MGSTLNDAGFVTMVLTPSAILPDKMIPSFQFLVTNERKVRANIHALFTIYG